MKAAGTATSVSATDHQKVLAKAWAGGAAAWARAAGETLRAAEHAGVAAPTASRLLDGLVGAGLVTRCPGEHDRRRADIALTPAGQSALRARREVVERWRRRVFDALPPDEREPAERILGRLSDILDGLEP